MEKSPFYGYQFKSIYKVIVYGDPPHLNTLNNKDSGNSKKGPWKKSDSRK